MNVYIKLKLLVGGLLFLPSLLFAQNSTDTANFTIDQCVIYAFENRPSMQQAEIDEAIGERQINAQLADWLPQISARFNLQHNLILPTSILPDFTDLSSGRRVPVKMGVANTSNLLFQLDQTIFNNEVLMAAKAAKYTRAQLDQLTVTNKINTVVEVSKAFYDVLLTEEQLEILDQNIQRLERQYSDAYNRYEFGLVDKTDYQRAGIALANTRSDRKRVLESINPKIAYLKQLMGYPVESPLNLVFDRESIERELQIDTTQQLNFNNRIEYQLLQTRRNLVRLNTAYYRWDFLPDLSGFFNYNFVYQNNEFNQLYNQNYPASAVGLSLGLPIFQGTKRLQNIRIAQLQEDRLELDIENTNRAINTEYEAALADYKSDYNDWLTLRQNVEAAQEVYEIIQLQYQEGIKAYLDLIIAESDLRTTQLNYYNALFNVLASKLDYERALGNININ